MCAHHDVGKFQIAVYDATCVRVAHGVAHLLEDGDEAAQSLGRPLPLLEQLAQRVALDELHGQKRLAVGERANFVGGRHARVLQLAGDGGLDAEAHGGRRIGRHLGLERLDSHVSVEERVACAADHAHAARADLLGQFVAARQQLTVGRGRKGIRALARVRSSVVRHHGTSLQKQNSLHCTARLGWQRASVVSGSQAAACEGVASAGCGRYASPPLCKGGPGFRCLHGGLVVPPFAKGAWFCFACTWSHQRRLIQCSSP